MADLSSSDEVVRFIAARRSQSRLIWACLSLLFGFGLASLFFFFRVQLGFFFNLVVFSLILSGVFFIFSWSLYELTAMGDVSRLTRSHLSFYFGDKSSVTMDDALIIAEDYSKIGFFLVNLGLLFFLISLEMADVVILMVSITGLLLFVFLPIYYRNYAKISESDRREEIT